MSKSLFLRLLFIITIANFVAQIPYYLYQYYVPSHVAPSILGLLLMVTVLAWFIVGYIGLARGKNLGYLLILSFLFVEFLFYLQTQITQYLSGHGILLYVLHPQNPLLFLVFGIGYINFLASAWFIYYMRKRRLQYYGSGA